MAERIMFYSTEQIGPNRAIDPRGFLVCTDVPLARIGMMNYAAGETPVAVGPKGYVEIERSADEVFDPRSLASYVGAPLVDDHPTVDVTPMNWRDLAHGVVLNPRRGEIDMIEFVLGDLVVKSPELIDAVQNGKREVSVGYSCDYDQVEPGKGRQRNIVVNHVALVERGRCGPRCAIGDKLPEPTPEPPTMTIKAVATKPSGSFAIIRALLSSARTASKAKDEAGVEQSLVAAEALAGMTLDEDPDKKDDKDDKDDKKTSDALDQRMTAMDARIGAIDETLKKIGDSIEELKKKKDDDEDEGKKKEKTEDEALLGALQMEAPPGTSDAAMKSTKDSSLLAFAYQDTVALAEILAPGIQPPTFDQALPPAKTFDSICKHRRAALAQAFKEPVMHSFLTPKLGGKTFDTLTCAETRAIFKDAAALRGALNNGKAASVTLPGPGVKTKSPVTSIADLNEIGRKKYGAKH